MISNSTTNNYATITGTIYSEPEFDHEVKGNEFYKCYVKVIRLSGTDDILPVVYPSNLVFSGLNVGDRVTIVGQFRSYNKISTDGANKLLLFLYAREIIPTDSEDDNNEVSLIGFVCRTPVYRVSPSGKEICDLTLAINRGKRSDYIPSIAWGTYARGAKNLKVGDHVSVSGRIQSRKYKKVIDGVEEYRTAYELSIKSISLVKEENLDLNLD